jgi:hypothetical protein
MDMNPRQQTILKVFCAYLAITMLWPPFYIGVDGGGVFGLGYGFLFSPPHDRGRVDVAQLMAQWIAGAAIAGFLIFQFKNWTQRETPGFLKRIGPALTEGFKRSWLWLAALAGFALIKLFTPSIDHGKQAAFALILFIGYLPIYAAIWLWHTQRAYRGIAAVRQKTEASGISWKRISIALVIFFIASAALMLPEKKPWENSWNKSSENTGAFDDLLPKKTVDPNAP